MEDVSFGMIMFSCFMALNLMLTITLVVFLVHDFYCGVRTVVRAIRIWKQLKKAGSR